MQAADRHFSVNYGELLEVDRPSFATL